jgi:hypothetical protein
LEQQDYYETIIFEKDPGVVKMKWIDWDCIDENPLRFDAVLQNITSCGLDKFVNEVQQDWC